MRAVLGLVVVGSLLFVVGDASAEAPSAIGAANEPEPEWACAASGVEAARIAAIERPITAVRAADLDALVLEPSDVPYVIVEGDSNAVVAIAPVVGPGGALEIERNGCAASKSPLRVIVGVAAIETLEVERVARVRSRAELAVAGDAVIDIDGAIASELELRGESVAVFTAGGGFHRMFVRAETLVAHQSGAGVLRLTGEAAWASLGQDGAGYVVASDLAAGDLIIERAGSGEVHVAAVE